MYVIKENKCFYNIALIRFQDTIDMKANDRQIRVFQHTSITAENAAIVNFSGTIHQDVTFDVVVNDGAVQVIVTNNGDGSFPLTYNVTVL